MSKLRTLLLIDIWTFPHLSPLSSRGYFGHQRGCPGAAVASGNRGLETSPSLPWGTTAPRLPKLEPSPHRWEKLTLVPLLLPLPMLHICPTPWPLLVLEPAWPATLTCCTESLPYSSTRGPAHRTSGAWAWAWAWGFAERVDHVACYLRTHGFRNVV